jgi:ubiquitin C-terminal hydrolase
MFHLPNMTEKILSFNPDEFNKHFDSIKYNTEMDQVDKIKMLASRDIVKNLQFMIASMLLSNVKYQDPTDVLESVVDDYGNKISIYEQKDIGEFFLNFLDRLQDGLCENKSAIRKIMGHQLAQNMRKMSFVKGERSESKINEYYIGEDESKP